MLRIEMLPALHGDCLWIEYPDGDRTRRLLIDGGPGPAWKTLRDRLAALPASDRRFDLLVVTHIDADHIEGIVQMLADEALEVSIDEIWFNGWHHLPKSALTSYGGLQGEQLSALIERRGLSWNRAFGGGPVMVPEEGNLPVVELPGGLRLTLLSPRQRELERLVGAWESEVRKAGLVPGQSGEPLTRLEASRRASRLSFSQPGADPVPGWRRVPYVRDTSPANGSSIAFLAELRGRSCLFAADAFSEVLEITVDRLIRARGVDSLAIDAFKLPHHGSDANLRPELLRRLRCRHYLVSTNGDRFDHPDPPALARLLEHSPPDALFHFNYRTEQNAIWADPSRMERYRYTARYPDRPDAGLVLELPLLAD